MLWKLYFWVMAIAAVLGLTGALLGERHEVYPAADDILLVVSVVQLLGLFGYVYRKPLLSAAIWRKLFAVFVVAFAANVIVGAYRFNLIQDVGMPAASIAVAISLYHCSSHCFSQTIGTRSAVRTFGFMAGSGQRSNVPNTWPRRALMTKP